MSEQRLSKSYLTLLLASFLALLLQPVIAFAQKPELVVQAGHSEQVLSVAYSPDGEILASGSEDHTVRLWDAASGKELCALTGHSNAVTSVAFSPDGKTLASSSIDDMTIRLWDVASGKELRTISLKSSVFSVAFSPDGKTLASANEDKTIKLWEVASGKELRTLAGHLAKDLRTRAGVERELRTLAGHFYPVRSVTFSPDGKTLASGSVDTTIRLWDVTSGKELRILAGHTSTVQSVAFSPDGKTLASGSHDEKIKLWEVASGVELGTLQGFAGYVWSLVFSPDGKTLASGNDDDSIRLWNVETRKELRILGEDIEPREMVEIREEANESKDAEVIFLNLKSVAFSPDGKTLAGNIYKTVKLWDVTSGKELRTLEGHSVFFNSVEFSLDGKTLASGGVEDNTIRLWDLASGKELRTLLANGETAYSVAFSPDGKTLAYGAGPEITIGLVDVASGKELRTFTGHSDSIQSLAFSPDGKTLASGEADGIIELWDVTSGKELRVLEGHLSLVRSIAFSPDGKTLASWSRDGIIDLFSVRSGKILRTLKGAKSIAFSPDGKTLAVGGEDKTVKLWDVRAGRILRTLTGHSAWVISVMFSPDGKTLASGSSDNIIKLWNAATGRELRTLTGHSSYVLSVAFSPDGKTLVSGSGDTKIKLWDIATGTELCSLIAIDKNGWLVVTPKGLFDGSPTAWRQLIWRFDNNVLNFAPVEAYFNDFFYPGLLQDIMRGKRPVPPGGKDLSKTDRRRPAIKLALAQPPAKPDEPQPARTATIRVEVTENADKPQDATKPVSGGAQDVRLFRNGSLVKVWRGDVLKGERSVTLEASVPIVAGDNQLTAYAFNHDNVKSEDGTLAVTGALNLKRKGTAYILAVGLNEYANAQYNLKYAVADARGFGAELKRQQEQMQTYERVEVISLFDKDATKEKILQALTDLQGRTQPEDAVIVYFAGHGTAHENQFYLIPHDLGYEGGRDALDKAGLEAILSHSISDRELEQAFERVDAEHILLVIDACNSGQALEAEEKRRGPMNSKGLAQLAYEKGMYVLTAAQSFQAAQEASQLGHGLLTYVLVEEGLTQSAADYEPKDGEVRVREWLDYATRRVPEMQIKEMGRALARGINLSFADEERQLEIPQRNGQRPRVFYRRELEAQPFIVARH